MTKKIEFKVGDRVRVKVKKYGKAQYHDVGRVIIVYAHDSLPVGVEFEKGYKQHSKFNSYDHRDLEAFPLVMKDLTTLKAKKAPKGKQAYKGNGHHNWEPVVSTSTMRLRVPGGWLYKGQDNTPGALITRTMVFVPVPSVVGYAV